MLTDFGDDGFIGRWFLRASGWRLCALRDRWPAALHWVTPFMCDADDGPAAISTILGWMAEGLLRVLEGPSFPVGQAAAAHTAIEARATFGKVSLSVDEASWGRSRA